MNQPLLLVVDDEPNNFDVIEIFLAESGYELYYANSGQEALSSIAVFQPDIILLDIMMPDLDGIEVCQRIKRSPDGQMIPIIMVTALSAKEDLARCLAAGADDFISKPVNAIELRARVQSMLRIKQQHDKIKNLSQLQVNTIELLQNTLSELRANLFANLPHELNTPLNGISGVISMMLDRYDTLSSEEMHLLLLLAQQSAKRLEKLTQKFLTYAELAWASLPGSNSEANFVSRRSLAEPMGIDSFIQQTAVEQAHKVNRSADLLLNLAAIHNLKATFDPKDLQCILEELLDNAFKFSQPGTPVTVTVELLNQRWHLWVGDRGRGMTPEQITQIGTFRQFERQTYAQQGLGLGLKIVQKITELYGGEFLISSIYQQETQVHLTFPIVP